MLSLPLPLVLLALSIILVLASSFSFSPSSPSRLCVLPHHHPTAIFSSTITTQEDEAKQQRSSSQHDVQNQQQLTSTSTAHECKGCKRTFKTRNSLFRHLRGDDIHDIDNIDNNVDCPLSMGAKPEKELLFTTAIRYGYYYYNNENSSNEIVARLIHDGFVHYMTTFLGSGDGDAHGDGDEDDDFTVSTSALTYGTAAKMRQPSLRYEHCYLLIPQLIHLYHCYQAQFSIFYTYLLFYILPTEGKMKR